MIRLLPGSGGSSAVNAPISTMAMCFRRARCPAVQSPGKESRFSKSDRLLGLDATRNVRVELRAGRWLARAAECDVRK
jgi:hypothetical protein